MRPPFTLDAAFGGGPTTAHGLSRDPRLAGDVAAARFLLAGGIILPALLAGCLDQAPAAEVPGNLTNTPADGPGGGEPHPPDGAADCVPVSVAPARAEVPHDVPLEITIRFQNCEPGAVTLGSGDACDAANGLEPSMEPALGSARTFRFGIVDREDAVDARLHACDAGTVAPRSVAPGEVVEARVPWNGTLVENPCKTGACPQHVRAEPDTYGISVTYRPEQPGVVLAYSAALQLVPPES